MRVNTDQPRCILCGKVKHQEDLKGYNSLAPVGMRFDSAYCKISDECDSLQSEPTTGNDTRFNQRFYDQDVLDEMQSKVINWEMPSVEEVSVLYRASDFDIRKFVLRLHFWLDNCKRSEEEVGKHIIEICYRIGK